MTTFETVIKNNDVSIFGLNEYLGLPDNVVCDASDTRSEIVWSIEMEMRDWGVKSIIVTVGKASASFGWEVADEELTTESRQHISSLGATLQRDGYWRGDVNLTFTGEEIEDAIEVESSIRPDEVEIDLRKGVKKIFVY